MLCAWITMAHGVACPKSSNARCWVLVGVARSVGHPGVECRAASGVGGVLGVGVCGGVRHVVTHPV